MTVPSRQLPYQHTGIQPSLLLNADTEQSEQRTSEHKKVMTSEDSPSEIDLHVMQVRKAFTLSCAEVLVVDVPGSKGGGKPFTLSRAEVLAVDVIGLEKVTNDSIPWKPNNAAGQDRPAHPM